METQRKMQFEFLERARSLTKNWSKRESIKLHRIEFIVPFVATDFSLFVWFFYRLDLHVSAYATDGISRRLEQYFRLSLKEIGYPLSWQRSVTIDFDSDENVQNNFDGNYFYRLRWEL